MPTAYCLDGSNRPSRASQVPASSACHIYMRLEIRRMTGEVIKTGTTSLLSLILNMNHPSILDVWVCRHIWFSGEEAFACCLTLWLPFFWQEPLKCRPRGMDNGLSHSGTASHTLCAIPSDSHSRCSLHYTSPLFNPREVLASGQPSLSVWVTEYVHACVCVCGNVGSACSPRAMLINALQTKCSPFSLFSLSPPLLPSSAHLSSPLSGHCWEGRRRWCWGTGRGAGGKYMNKAEYERKYTIAGFDNAELSRCLPAAFSVWCWERSIYSTESYSSDCLSLVTPYITNQPSPYYRTRAATNACFHCRVICRLFCELIDWLDGVQDVQI